MANHYTQFSEVIPAKSHEERDFISMGFTAIDDLTDRLSADAEAAGTYDEDHDYAADAKALYTAEFGEDAFDIVAEGWTCQEFEIEKDGGVWVSAEEGGSLDLIGYVVAAWQKKFDIQEPWQITWSSSCSKPRVGEFGGGGMVVYKGKTHSLSAFSWAEEMKKLLKDSEPASGEAALSVKVIALQDELIRVDYDLHAILKRAGVREVVDEGSRDDVLAAIKELALGGGDEDGDVHAGEAGGSERRPEESPE